jgi:hypothetical protein
MLELDRHEVAAVTIRAFLQHIADDGIAGMADVVPERLLICADALPVFSSLSSVTPGFAVSGEEVGAFIIFSISSWCWSLSMSRVRSVTSFSILS